jgi:uridine kinase
VYDGWDGLPDAGRRVQEQVVGPLAEERPAAYSRYDWHQGRFDGSVVMPVVDVLVLEGVGSADPLYADRTSLVVWVWAPDELRLSRGIARDGVELEGHLRRWMRDEQELHERHRTAERADVVVDGRTGRLSRGLAGGA